MYNDKLENLTVHQDPSYDNKKGWAFLNEEIGWFVCDFFINVLDAEQKLIFYSYYINGMTLEEISDRMYGSRQISKFKYDYEASNDDRVVDDIDTFHTTYQEIQRRLDVINSKLAHAWKYTDRWR